MLCIIFLPKFPKVQEHYATPQLLVVAGNMRVKRGPYEPVQAGCLSDPPCDNPVLNNSNRMLQFTRGKRHWTASTHISLSLVFQLCPCPASHSLQLISNLFYFLTFHHTHNNSLCPLYKIFKKKSHIKQSSLVSTSLTFSRCWQGAWGVWWAQLSSGFSYCCYSVAYSKNNTLLLPQPLDLDITPQHSIKGYE